MVKFADRLELVETVFSFSESSNFVLICEKNKQQNYKRFKCDKSSVHWIALM